MRDHDAQFCLVTDLSTSNLSTKKKCFTNLFYFQKRRPISIQERIPYTTTTAQPTTTTPYPPEEEEESTVINRLSRLTLPSNATSIRSDITDNFSCANRRYGYYADVENDW